MCYLITLKFGTQIGGVGAHLGIKFGVNKRINHRVINDHSQKITPICCHTHRINCLWEEAKNRYVDRATIEPQTFCGLKEIKLKVMKIT